MATLRKLLGLDKVDEKTKVLCNKIEEVKLGDTQGLFSCIHQMAYEYYGAALRQGWAAFISAQFFGAIGTFFFLYAAYLFFQHPDKAKVAWLTAMAGGLVQVITYLNFSMYRRATRQFELFHACLERTARYLMADSVAQNISSSDGRDKSRIDLVSTMGRAPMLPVEGLIRTKDKEFQTSVRPQTKAKTAAA